MYKTIRVSSCVSVQGDVVEHLPNGDVVIRDGVKVYRGRPVAPVAVLPGADTRLQAVSLLRDQA